MKRRYKLALIIITGCLITFFINSVVPKNKITLVAIGDSFSAALTPSGVVGTSFTDYTKEYLENKKLLDSYNYDYSYDHLLLTDLNDFLDNNTLRNGLAIKQLIAQADIITIAIGIDELADISLRKNIDNEVINNYITEYETILKQIRAFYKKKIIVAGLYPVYNVTKNDIVDLNKKMSVMCGKYDALFIDILPFAINSEYYFKPDSYYLNYKIHKKISEIIVKYI